MKRTALLFVVGVTMLSLPGHVANAWMHSGYFGTMAGGGGSWAAHGFHGGTAQGGGGSWDAHSAYGGSASGGEGSWTAHGASGGTAQGGGGSWNAQGAYGGSASGGYHQPATVYAGSDHYGGSYYGYYHPPATVNYYGSECSNCGGWNAGAAAATGYIAGATMGAAQANAETQAATANAYAAGAAADATASAPSPVVNDVYAKLPANCQYIPAANVTYYRCGATWLEPAFGANGVYYRVVPAP
ncbi:MAG TPA: hypothetical protein VM659_13650 [Dongiaceae bacterium]|nr:hypothetical protein [Dongiaceae bacterium]